MYCRNCGTELPEKARFCSKCGTQVQRYQPKASGQKDKEQVDWAALVRAMQMSSGDQRMQAYDRLYTVSFPKVYSYVQYYARNEETANDCAEEALMDLLTKVDTIKEPGGYLKWIRRNAYNKFVDRIRKDSKLTRFDVVMDDEGNETSAEEFLADETLPMPEDAYANEELQRLVQDGLDHITVIQRACVVGRYWEEKSVQELAEEYDLPVNTVKTHLKRGRDKLREQFEDYANAYGLKLVPMAIVPFMAMLAGQEVKACEVGITAATTAASLASVHAALGAGTAAGATGTTAAGAATASTATGTAATGATAAAGTGLAVKVGAGVVAAAVAAGGAGAVYMRTQNHGAVSNENHAATMYERYVDRDSLAGDAALTSEVSYEELDPTFSDYEGDEGIYAILYRDLDHDDLDELVMFHRYEDENTEGLWHIECRIMDWDGDTTVTTRVQELGSCNVMHDRDDANGFVIYYKELDNEDEILCLQYENDYTNADAYEMTFSAYRYKAGEIYEVNDIDYRGEDITGRSETDPATSIVINADDYTGALRSMHLDQSATVLADAGTLLQPTTSVSDQAGGYRGFLSSTEPDITPVIELYTTYSYDEAAAYEYSVQNMTPAQGSNLTRSLMFRVHDDAHALYAADRE